MIKATVALIWPYSSHTEKAALLLAEADFRLRRSKGQVRVQFSGPGAKAVARSGVGIGDEVSLVLQGAAWLGGMETANVVGKGIEWELLHTQKLSMQVRRDSHKLANLEVDQSSPPPKRQVYPRTPPQSISQTKEDVSQPTSADRRIGLGTLCVWALPDLLKRSLRSKSWLSRPECDPVSNDDDPTEGNGLNCSRKPWKDTEKWRCIVADEVNAPNKD
ncbi:hypothetical protein LTR50_002786 [Elasticomyces elasticus]|nr:hypothetical protein LTR50_002786 [Elasticomyces elasticus]